MRKGGGHISLFVKLWTSVSTEGLCPEQCQWGGELFSSLFDQDGRYSVGPRARIRFEFRERLEHELRSRSKARFRNLYLRRDKGRIHDIGIQGITKVKIKLIL